MTTEAAGHVHKAAKSDPDTCRICGASMVGSDQDIAAAFDASLAAAVTPAPTSVPEAAPVCIRCSGELVVGAVCCGACGLPVTWAGSTPCQNLPANEPDGQVVSSSAVAQTMPIITDASPTRPTKLIPDPDVPAEPPLPGTAFLRVIVRCNRDIHNLASNPKLPEPEDPSVRTYDIRGERAEFGRPDPEGVLDSSADRILALDGAVSVEHATFERLPDGSWEVRDHSRNGSRLNHRHIASLPYGAPAGTGEPIKQGDVLWAGYFTELEVVAAG